MVQMGLGRLGYRRDLHLCGQMYRRSRIEEYFDYRDLPTRQFNKIVLKVPDVILTKTFKGSAFKGANLWNALPYNVQLSPTYKEFKYRYKQTRLDHPPWTEMKSDIEWYVKVLWRTGPKRLQPWCESKKIGFKCFYHYMLYYDTLMLWSFCKTLFLMWDMLWCERCINTREVLYSVSHILLLKWL